MYPRLRISLPTSSEVCPGRPVAAVVPIPKQPTPPPTTPSSPELEWDPMPGLIPPVALTPLAVIPPPAFIPPLNPPLLNPPLLKPPNFKPIFNHQLWPPEENWVNSFPLTHVSKIKKIPCYLSIPFSHPLSNRLQETQMGI